MRYVVIGLTLILAGCGTRPTCTVDQLQVGASKEEILKLCGKPNRINYSGPYGDKIHEQWVYSYSFPLIGGTYLYLDGGKFTSIQWSE